MEENLTFEELSALRDSLNRKEYERAKLEYRIHWKLDLDEEEAKYKRQKLEQKAREQMLDKIRQEKGEAAEMAMLGIEIEGE